MFEKYSSSELNNLVIIYFGQDYDLIDDSDEIEPKIDAYIAASHKGMKHVLLEDIDSFLALGDALDSTFQDYYGFHFAPELWGTTPRDFLLLVKKKVSQALQKEDHNLHI